MFTWICPVCGAEVPPSEQECPRCKERQRGGARPGGVSAPPAEPAAPPQAPSAWTPPAAAPPPPPGVAPEGRPPAAPAPRAGAEQAMYMVGAAPPRRALPAWLAALLTLAVLGGGLFLLYRYLSGSRGAPEAVKQAAPFERPQAQASAHPFAKYVEVTGIRLLEGPDKKLMVRFVVVNHAPAELSRFRLRISLETANAAPGEAVIAVVDAAPGTIPAHGVKDMEAPLVTPLKVYELPDWQYVRARVEIIDAK